MGEGRAERNGFLRDLTAKDTWIPPAFGVVASILVSLIGRAVELDYRSEVALGAFLLVSAFTSYYRSGLLKSKPLTAIAVSLASAAVGMAVFFLIT
jgi:hypothetical protein